MKVKHLTYKEAEKFFVEKYTHPKEHKNISWDSWIYVKHKFKVYEACLNLDGGGSIKTNNGHVELVLIPLEAGGKAKVCSILNLRDDVFSTNKDFFFDNFNNIWE